ncbi:MAG: phage portal protein [Dorea sp.]|nr:phage portal protein [Dorea sp.]
MPRARSPKRDEAYRIWLSSGKEKTLKEIAAELGVSETQVRKWKNQDKWNSNVTNPNGNVTNPKSNVTNQKKIPCSAEKDAVAEEVQQVTENSGLTDKQRLFCISYIRCFNATKAYQKAYGVSYDTAMAAGSQLLRNIKVREQIQRLKQNRLNREFLEEPDIFQKYMDIAFADMTEFVQFGHKEVPVIGPDGLPVEVTDEETGERKQLTREINVVRFRDSDEVDGTLISEVKQGRDGASIKLADRMKALDWISSHMSLATEEQKAKIEHLRANTEKLKSDSSSDGIEAIKAYVESVTKSRGQQDGG